MESIFGGIYCICEMPTFWKPENQSACVINIVLWLTLFFTSRWCKIQVTKNLSPVPISLWSRTWYFVRIVASHRRTILLKKFSDPILSCSTNINSTTDIYNSWQWRLKRPPKQSSTKHETFQKFENVSWEFDSGNPASSFRVNEFEYRQNPLQFAL